MATIVLAAGAGTRFGGGKLEGLLDDRPLLAHALDAAAASDPDWLIVVIDAEAVLAATVDTWALKAAHPPLLSPRSSRGERLASASGKGFFSSWAPDSDMPPFRRLRRLFPPRVGAKKVIIVRAPHTPIALARSLRAGIAALPGEADGAFILLGDMPRIPHEIFAPLAHPLRAGALAAAPFHEGVRGHPVALSRALFADVSRLEGDAGAGALIKGLGDRLARIDTDDPGVLLDIDTPEDLALAAP